MTFFKELISAAQKLIQRHDNHAFLEGVMAACAIVAVSDGKVSFAERSKLDQIISVVDRLKIYDPHEAVDLFNDYASLLRKNGGEINKKEKNTLLDLIHDVFTTREDKQILLKICWAICKSDGTPLKYEYEAIEEIATHIDMNVRDVFENY